jgi:hypothetical protein
MFTFRKLAPVRTGHLLLPALLFFIVAALAGCSLRGALEREQLGNLGYFEYRDARPHMAGVVIGTPHGAMEPEAALLAGQISERIGAGFVAAYGFNFRHVSVAQPVAHNQPIRVEPAKRRSVFREFKEILREISGGEIDLYVELRGRAATEGLSEIRVVSSGFTLEEAKIIEQAYIAATERIGKTKLIPSIPMSIDPTGGTSPDTWGMRHHGVLMIAGKGLSLRIPEQFLSGPGFGVGGEVLAAWIESIVRLAGDSGRGVPRIEVKRLDFGRFDSIRSRARRPGIVIGAPHGSYDLYTAEIVTQLAFRTGLAAVIARGFTPTESGDGRRINVNRPTERYVSLSDREFETERARDTYKQFTNSVLSAAGANLDLYIDIHQNSGSRIEVATVGLSKEEARNIKNAYLAARDQALAASKGISVVDLAIEPLDQLEVGAWAAKTNGILTLANRSLHFELPGDVLMAPAQHREFYTLVLAQVIAKLPAMLRPSS